VNRKGMMPVLLLSLASALAYAGGGHGQGGDNQGGNSQGDNQQGRHSQGIYRTVAAPEFDWAQAMGAFVLLGGSVAILRGRRQKKKK
jgi:hypothetical protein